MGYVVHHAVIVTIPEHFHRPTAARCDERMPDIAGFRATLPDQWQPLLVGPIPSVINGDVTYVFAPDGSKEGWPDSDKGDEFRRQFADLFRFYYEDGSTPFEVVEVGYDHDSRAARDPREATPLPEKPADA